MPPFSDIAGHWTPLSADIEAAALRAWPALEEKERDGWTLRFAEGYSKRSNCVLTGMRRGEPDIPTDELNARVLDCERIYGERGMRTVFKLHGGAPAGLDELLEKRGYAVAEHTLLMSLGLAETTKADRKTVTTETIGPHTAAPNAKRESVISGEPSSSPADRRAAIHYRIFECDAWLEHWCRCSETNLAGHATHRSILGRIEPETGFLGLTADGEEHPFACAMAVADGRHLGIFDVIVAERSRRRGLGGALMRGLLDFGRDRGAELAYLQVVRHNRAARALYDSLGFAPAGSYWYRVSPDPRQHHG